GLIAGGNDQAPVGRGKLPHRSGCGQIVVLGRRHTRIVVPGTSRKERDRPGRAQRWWTVVSLALSTRRPCPASESGKLHDNTTVGVGVSLRCTIADKGEPMAEYQALAPATRQLATTPPFTVAHCSSRDSSLQPLHRCTQPDPPALHATSARMQRRVAFHESG